MKNFILGIIFTLVAILIGALIFTRSGFANVTADTPPNPIETILLKPALDPAIERHAPRADNPVQMTDANLIQGMKLYTMNCALCHGSLNQKPNTVGAALSPDAPNLILKPLDDPEWHTFYATKHGIRMTGMPAWGGILTDDDLWRITGFLSRLDKLPPALQEEIKKAFPL